MAAEKTLAETIQSKLKTIGNFSVSNPRPGQSMAGIVAELAVNNPQSMGAPLNDKTQPIEKCSLIGFTSGCGGSGLSSCAKTLGKIYARLYGYQCLYISFERVNKAFKGTAGAYEKDAEYILYRLLEGPINTGELKALCSLDVYGLYSFPCINAENPVVFEDLPQILKALEILCGSGLFHRIILDIPCDFRYWKDLMAVCEFPVMVYSWNERLWGASEAAKSILLNAFEGFRDRAYISELKLLYDNDSFEGAEADIHGQLGAQVRELADSIEEAIKNA